jgi:hypothetical protein
MPRNGKKQSKTAHKLSEAPASPRLPFAEQYFGPSSTRPAIYPNIYYGGTRTVETWPQLGDIAYKLSSIMNQAEYSHLSPEVRYYSCAQCVH